MFFRYFDLYEEPPADVTCFDLDTATISHSTMRKSLKLSILPKKPLKRLRASLETVLKQMTEDVKKIRASISAENSVQSCKATWEIVIREAFLRYF